MKKLFTLMMILAVAMSGFAQVKSVSKLDGKNGVQKMRMANRSEGVETLENVQSQSLMTRVDFGSGELDYTTYDWQTNAAARNWTLVWDDNTVNFAYTQANNESFSDRGTGIGTYDYTNDEWIPLGGRIESEKTGFGSIARYKENGIVVAAHTATECGIYIIEDRDNMTPNSLPVTSRVDNTNEPAWPVVMTSGPNRDIIHMVATGSSDNKLYYFRTRNGGETWEKQNVVLPFLTEEYGSDWGSNVCYFMETTEDNCLALVVNNAWSDCFVMYSYDDGETWERKVFYHHPGINSTFDSWFMYPRWASCQWDSKHNLHVLYEFNGSTGEPASGSYYPGIGGVSYWSEVMPYHGDGTSQSFGCDPTNPMPCVPGEPFIMDSAYIYEDIYASWWLWSDATHEMWSEYVGYLPALTPQGDPEPDPYNVMEFNIDDRTLHGSYNSGCVAFPVLCMVPGSDDMVAVWSAMDENCTDGNGNFYYHLFASASADGGYTWSPMVALTSDIIFTFAELVYNQAVVLDRTLVVATQADGFAGTFVQGDEDDATDCYYQGLTYDLDELFPGIGMGTSESHNTKMNIWPNPTNTTLNVNLNHSAEIVVYNMMGQVVANYNGTIGANSIDVSNLSSGVYFISAGSDTQKFVVK